MITPEQSAQIDALLQSKNYTPSTSGGASWFKPYQGPQQDTTTPEPNILEKIGEGAGQVGATAIKGLASISPGQKIGEALGATYAKYAPPSMGGVGGTEAAKNIQFPSAESVVGDIGQAATTVGGLALAPTSAVGRLGLGAGIGAALGGTEAMKQDKPTGEVAKSAAIGGGVGLGTAGLAEGVNQILQRLPNWLTKTALPALKSDNVDYALQNTKLGTVSSLLDNSNNAVKSYGNQIQSILEHPQYINETGDGAASIQGVLQNFPQAKLTPEQVVSSVSDVVPGSAKLVDKVADGSATLLEKNQLRQQLDIATKKRFTDTPTISFAKEVAGSLADTLRNEVKSFAPETEPIFENFSKEMDLNRALTLANRKIEKGAKIGLYDIAGYFGGGLPGVLAEKGVRAPGTQLAVAKGAQALQKGEPLISGLEKVPITKTITSAISGQK